MLTFHFCFTLKRLKSVLARSKQHQTKTVLVMGTIVKIKRKWLFLAHSHVGARFHAQILSQFPPRFGGCPTLVSFLRPYVWSATTSSSPKCATKPNNETSNVAFTPLPQALRPNHSAPLLHPPVTVSPVLYIVWLRSYGVTTVLHLLHLEIMYKPLPLLTQVCAGISAKTTTNYVARWVEVTSHGSGTLC